MEGGVDFISCLPEDILRQIVSLIPCKEAIRTAVLSDTWRKLWSPFHVNLELIDSSQKLSHESKERLTLIFAHLLKSYDYPEKLQICFQSEDYAKVNDKFIAIVTKGTHKNLHFDFSSSEKTNCRFNFVLDQLGPLNLNCPEFSSLKNLHLRLVPAAAETVMSDLFSNFQFLESLSLEKCRELKNIDLRANDFLTSLTILDCCNIDIIRFSAPKLRSFIYRGHLPDIQSVNAPNLTEVALNLRNGLGDNKAFDCEDVLCLLCCFKDVETLTISGWLLEWLCSAGVIFEHLDFKFNRLKELWCVNSGMDKRKRDSIACFLDATPIIEKLFVKNDPKCMNIQMSTPYFHTYWHDHHLWMDCATMKHNASPLKLLKQIELLNFTCKEEDEVLFLDLMLHKAINLKSMMMISPNKDTWKVNVVPSSQLCYQVKGCCGRYMVVPSPYGYRSSYLFTEAKRFC